MCRRKYAYCDISQQFLSSLILLTILDGEKSVSLDGKFGGITPMGCRKKWELPEKSYQINPWFIFLERDEEGRNKIISLSLNCNAQVMIEVEYRKAYLLERRKKTFLYD